MSKKSHYPGYEAGFQFIDIGATECQGSRFAPRDQLVAKFQFVATQFGKPVRPVNAPYPDYYELTRDQLKTDIHAVRVTPALRDAAESAFAALDTKKAEDSEPIVVGVHQQQQPYADMPERKPAAEIHVLEPRVQIQPLAPAV